MELIKDKSNQKYSIISYVSFLRRLPKNIILPSKKTDLCELSLGAKRVSFKEEKTEEKQLLIIYENHLENSIAQIRAFKEDILKLTDEKAMIVVDFKQNIRLGGSSEKVSAIFYTHYDTVKCKKSSPSFISLWKGILLF